MSLGDSGARSRTIWRRLVTGGPYVNEAMSLSVLSTIILVGLGVIALADHSVSSFPLASLYILPLTLCALVYPFPVTLVLCFECWMLHDFVSPFRESGFHQHVLRGGTTLLGYLGVVGVAYGLGAQRRRAAELAMTQRDELAAEIQLGAEVQQSILRVAAGLLMPSIEVALRMEARKTPGAGDLLHTFNNVVHQITGGTRFISLFYGKLSHILRLCNTPTPGIIHLC